MNPGLPDPVSATSAGDPVPDYEIAISVRPDYLYVAVSGTNSIETIRRYAADVREACVRLRQNRVLVVVNLYGPKLSMLDVYKAVAAGSDEAIGLGMRVAYVDIKPDPSVENMQIAEDVASTRGIPVRTFVDVGQAEAWLLDASHN
jgi:hypothetical protein